MLKLRHASKLLIIRIVTLITIYIIVTIFMNNREHEVRLSIHENIILFTAIIIHQFNTNQRCRTHGRTVRSHDDLLLVMKAVQLLTKTTYESMLWQYEITIKHTMNSSANQRNSSSTKLSILLSYHAT